MRHFPKRSYPLSPAATGYRLWLGRVPHCPAVPCRLGGITPHCCPAVPGAALLLPAGCWLGRPSLPRCALLWLGGVTPPLLPCWGRLLPAAGCWGASLAAPLLLPCCGVASRSSTAHEGIPVPACCCPCCARGAAACCRLGRPSLPRCALPAVG